MKKIKISFFIIIFLALSIGYLYYYLEPIVLTEIDKQDINSTSSEKQNEVLSEIQPSKQDQTNESNEHLQFIYNGHLLIKNFLLEIDYSKELTKLKSTELPDYLLPLIKDLEEFKEKYLSKDIEAEEIFPNDPFLEKFIIIKKDNNGSKTKEALKLKILENFGLLERFLFASI